MAKKILQNSLKVFFVIIASYMTYVWIVSFGVIAISSIHRFIRVLNNDYPYNVYVAPLPSYPYKR